LALNERTRDLGANSFSNATTQRRKDAKIREAEELYCPSDNARLPPAEAVMERSGLFASLR
jgi:hypothetical protein